MVNKPRDIVRRITAEAKRQGLDFVLDREGANLRRGRYPDSTHGQRIAALLRRVADDFDN